MKSKSIREWLEELEEPYRSDALGHMNHGDSAARSMSDAISSGFVWANANLGQDDWRQRQQIELAKEAHLTRGTTLARNISI